MKGVPIYYLPQELAWIEARKEMPRPELHEMFCAYWQRDDVSYGAFISLCKRKGWKTGRTGRLEKGQVPWNKGKRMPDVVREKCAGTMFRAGNRSGKALQLHRPIGTERMNDGYRERKVHDGLPMHSRWRAVHLIEWEAVHGLVPEGDVLKCLDGDRLNTDPSNWEPIPRALLPRLAGVRGRGRRLIAYDDASPEVKPALLAVAKLEHAVRQARKPKPAE